MATAGLTDAVVFRTGVLFAVDVVVLTAVVDAAGGWVEGTGDGLGLGLGEELASADVVAADVVAVAEEWLLQATPKSPTTASAVAAPARRPARPSRVIPTVTTNLLWLLAPRR